jgi:hypothetical protein
MTSLLEETPEQLPPSSKRNARGYARPVVGSTENLPLASSGSGRSVPYEAPTGETPLAVCERIGIDDRTAILESLYQDRRELLVLETTGRLKAEDKDRLADIEREIDRWEAPLAPSRNSDVWAEIEALARDTLGLQGEIASKKAR